MKKRYFLVALLLALTFLTCCAAALADDDVPPPEQISANPNFSMVDWYLDVMPLADDLKITRTTIGISRIDSTHVGVRSVTEANQICCYVRGYLGVQQWKDNQWITYKTASYRKINTDAASG